MTYTLDVNGKRYELNEDFRQAIQRRAEGAYRKNPQFSCWWKQNEDGEPVLVIETVGPMVPWDRLDEVELRMAPQEVQKPEPDDDEEGEELDAGNGMKVVDPPDDPEPEPTHDSRNDIFGRTHFSITPPRYSELPSPNGDDPEKIPPAPETIGDEPSLVMWIPKHPDIDHRWTTGEAITVFNSWVEWNVQKRANQPDPIKDKPNTHDRFESLCLIHDCEKVGEAEPNNDIPQEVSGEVERKGEKSFEDGKYGGSNWSV